MARPDGVDPVNEAHNARRLDVVLEPRVGELQRDHVQQTFFVRIIVVTLPILNDKKKKPIRAGAEL